MGVGRWALGVGRWALGVGRIILKFIIMSSLSKEKIKNQNYNFHSNYIISLSQFCKFNFFVSQ